MNSYPLLMRFLRQQVILNYIVFFLSNFVINKRNIKGNRGRSWFLCSPKISHKSKFTYCSTTFFRREIFRYTPMQRNVAQQATRSLRNSAGEQRMSGLAPRHAHSLPTLIGSFQTRKEISFSLSHILSPSRILNKPLRKLFYYCDVLQQFRQLKKVKEFGCDNGVFGKHEKRLKFVKNL